MAGSFTRSLSFRRWSLIVYWTLMFVATHWPELEEWAPRRFKIPDFDKFVHVVAYAGWAAMWWWLLALRPRAIGRSAIIWLLIGGAVYAAFDEITQDIVDRQPDILDFLGDMLGLVIAVIVLRVRQARFPPDSARSPAGRG